MKFFITMSADEVKAKIPYALICETRYGSVWNTMHRKRMWKDWFTEQERNATSKLFSNAYSWYLVKGLPDEITMSVSTLQLWQKLGEFCSCL